MKIITVLLSAAFLLCNCGGSNYTVSGHYGLAPGDSVFLFASNKSIIGSGVMATDTTFRLKGKVAGTDIATLSDRDPAPDAHCLSFWKRATSGWNPAKRACMKRRAHL